MKILNTKVFMKTLSLFLLLSLPVFAVAEVSWHYAVETEDFDRNTGWILDTATSGYQGEGYMTTDSSSGIMEYDVDFPAAGIYYIYIRNYATDHMNNGVHLGLDNVWLTSKPGDPEGIYFVKKSQWNWGCQWQRESGHEGPVYLDIDTPGMHIVKLKKREVGARVDRIIITDEMIDPPGEYSGTAIPGGLQVLDDYPNGYGGSGPGDNHPPSVDAGSNQIITLPEDTVDLNGTVTDPEDTPATAWSKISGPGTVMFGNAVLADTTATFSDSGAYVLQLTADDGTNPVVSDTITITVNPEPADDTDDDGIADWWEIEHFGSPQACDPDADPDDDGLTNREEFYARTDPWDPDTDGDGLPDGEDPDPTGTLDRSGTKGGCTPGSRADLNGFILFIISGLMLIYLTRFSLKTQQSDF